MNETLEMGTQVAWVIKSRNGKTTVGVSAIHRVFEGGKTFCNHAVPDEAVQLPPLKSLEVCSRCERMAVRAVEYAARQAKKVA